jgi:hypothetical protein
MSFLHYAFIDIWHFLGCLILLVVGLDGLAAVINALRR